MIPMARPVIEELDVEAVTRTLYSGYWASGPEVRAFEAEFAAYLGVRHAIAVTNGTVALHTALLGLGLQPGDKVLTTPFTFIATSNSILHCQAQPVFVDIDPTTFLLDLNAVEQALSQHPIKAVVVVHLFGQMCDVLRLRQLCKQADVSLIEDCAQSHGATYKGKQAGTVGDVGTFSFYATKNLPVGEGGMVTTHDDALAARMRCLINHGRTGGYEHAFVGYNYRLTDVLAALGRTQLARLSEGNHRRMAIATRYREGIQNPFLKHPFVLKEAGHVFHQYTLRCRHRSLLQEHLRLRGISSAVIYPMLSYQQKAYIALGLDGFHCPHAEQITGEVLSIPIYPSLRDEEVEQIISACQEFSL